VRRGHSELLYCVSVHKKAPTEPFLLFRLLLFADIFLADNWEPVKDWQRSLIFPTVPDEDSSTALFLIESVYDI
jgi:hypothetical protein